jgi:hypothetical protein
MRKSHLTKSLAGRIQTIMDLYQTPQYDVDTGELLGYKPTGLITREQMLELLNFPSENELHEQD